VTTGNSFSHQPVNSLGEGPDHKRTSTCSNEAFLKTTLEEVEGSLGNNYSNEGPSEVLRSRESSRVSCEANNLTGTAHNTFDAGGNPLFTTQTVESMNTQYVGGGIPRHD